MAGGEWKVFVLFQRGSMEKAGGHYGLPVK